MMTCTGEVMWPCASFGHAMQARRAAARRASPRDVLRVPHRRPPSAAAALSRHADAGLQQQPHPPSGQPSSGRAPPHAALHHASPALPASPALDYQLQQPWAPAAAAPAGFEASGRPDPAPSPELGPGLAPGSVMAAGMQRPPPPVGIHPDVLALGGSGAARPSAGAGSVTRRPMSARYPSTTSASAAAGVPPSPRRPGSARGAVHFAEADASAARAATHAADGYVQPTEGGTLGAAPRRAAFGGAGPSSDPFEPLAVRRLLPKEPQELRLAARRPPPTVGIMLAADRDVKRKARGVSPSAARSGVTPSRGKAAGRAAPAPEKEGYEGGGDVPIYAEVAG